MARKRRGWGRGWRGNCDLDVIYERKEKEGERKRGKEGGREGGGGKGLILRMNIFHAFLDSGIINQGKNNFFFTP